MIPDSKIPISSLMRQNPYPQTPLGCLWKLVTSLQAGLSSHLGDLQPTHTYTDEIIGLLPIVTKYQQDIPVSSIVRPTQTMPYQREIIKSFKITINIYVFIHMGVSWKAGTL